MENGLKFYKRDGSVVMGGVKEWAAAFENDDRTVELTNLWWGAIVSTVFLGINHRFGDGPPLIFETTVFPPWARGSDLFMDRYSTEAEAKRGHDKAVRHWRNPFFLAFIVAWSAMRVVRRRWVILWE